MQSIKNVLNHSWYLILASLQGAWLFLLYFLIGWVMVASLSSLQLRDSLEAGTKGGQTGTTYDQVKTIKNHFDIKVDNILARTYRQSEKLYDEVYKLETQIGDYFTSIYNQALDKSIIQDDLESEHPDKYYDIAINTVRRYCNSDQTSDANNVNAIQLICSELNEYTSLINKADLMYVQIDQKVADMESERQMRDLDEIAKLRKDTPFSELFTTVQFMSDWEFDSYLNQPRELLVLQLTMVMGTLGSLVTMTWLYIRRDTDLGFRRTLFLPLVGSVSAFIIFVFFKAGQLTISSGSGSSSLSPFFLSFVGIISGLLSERAYARMESVGAKFFTVDGDNLRWGVRLREALDASDITMEQLAKFLGADEGKVSNIVDEITSATENQQYLIAACLRKEARELFTDEPPAGIHHAAQLAPGTMIFVPNFVGLQNVNIKSVLSELGLNVGTITEVASSEPAGQILDQQPVAEKWVTKGTAINITLAAKK